VVAIVEESDHKRSGKEYEIVSKQRVSVEPCHDFLFHGCDYSIIDLPTAFVFVYEHICSSLSILSIIWRPSMCKPKIVFLIGGHGSHVTYPFGGLFDVTIICPTADSGGSTGELVRSYGVVPMGDMRRAFLNGIPASRRHTIKQVLESRFADGCLSAHTVGNIMITSLLSRLGNPNRAMDEMAKIFGAHNNWHVRPATLSPVSLTTVLSKGTRFETEGDLDQPEKIQRPDMQYVTQAQISPAGIDGNSEAIDAIMNADVVIMGPTDHVTSLLPILLVKDIAHAMANTKAQRIYVANLMTKQNETFGYTLSDFVRDIHRYAGEIIDHVIVNSGKISSVLRGRYNDMGQHLVHTDGITEAWIHPVVMQGDLIMRYRNDGKDGPHTSDHAETTQQHEVSRDPLLSHLDENDSRYIRHDPHKLMAKICEIYPELRYWL
jgi:uncharacterized cofD-like protein